jgi:hypothetical protein
LGLGLYWVGPIGPTLVKFRLWRWVGCPGSAPIVKGSQNFLIAAIGVVYVAIGAANVNNSQFDIIEQMTMAHRPGRGF